MAYKTEVWLAISFFSLALWAVYWFKPSYEHFFNVLQGVPDSYVSNLGIVYWSAHAGLNARFIGVVLGLFGMFMFWRPMNFKRVRILVSCAILFELYFAFLTPFIWNLSQRGVPFLSYAYLGQVIVTVPLMVVLSLKLYAIEQIKLHC